MLRTTVRSLLARKLRLLLASFAVLLGITFVSGAFVLTDSLSRVFDKLFVSANTGTAVTVTAKDEVGGGDFGQQTQEPVPQSVLDLVRKVPGVAKAVGDTGQPISLVLPDGKLFVKKGPPVLGFSYQADSPTETLTLLRGKAPVGLSEVLLDARTATKENLKIGDKVGLIGSSDRQTAAIVGLVRFGSSGSVAGATILAMDGPSAQKVFGNPAGFDQLSIASTPGTSDTELRDRVRAALPPGFEAKTGTERAAQQSDEIKEGLRFFNTFLQVFAYVALFVGMFLIFNTFSMLVAQRTRELALLRALGASRGQVLRSVLAEAVVVGLVSSLGGLGLGILLAKGFTSLMNSLGIEVPQGPTVLLTRTVVVCLVVGILATTVAALVPARRASRVAPVQALRESGPAEERSLARRTTTGSVVLGLGVAALVLGLLDSQLVLVGLGAALSFLGITVASPLFARPVVGLLATPFARLGIAGRLGRGNAMRSPRRTSTTAAALMIGLALVATISTVGSSAKDSVVKAVATSLGADYVLHADQFLPFSAAPEKGLQKAPELEDAAAFRIAYAKVSGKGGSQPVQSVDPKALQRVLKLDVKSGDLEGLSAGELALSSTVAKDLHKKVGDEVELTWAKTGKKAYTVAAVYGDNQFAGGYLVDQADYAANVTDDRVIVIAVKAAPGVSPQDSRAAIEKVLDPYPNVLIEDQAEFVKKQGDQIDSFLNVLTGLLFVSVLIAVLGIINTLALSVVERTRELGLLRAVGLQRRQLKRMIRVESVVIAFFGALLGIVVGVAFGYALVLALKDDGITEFTVPFGRIAFVLVVAGLGGVLAAALPARRAARLKVLDAIATA